MFPVLLCEKCGLVHPQDYDGLTCRNPGCGGKLIPTKIWGPEERNNYIEAIEDAREPPTIAS